MAKTRVEYEIRAKDKSKKATQDAEKNVKDLAGELKSFKKAVGTAFGAGAVIAFGKKVADVTGDLIQAYGQQERAELQLQAAIRNNPYMDGSAARRIGDFASELQQVTTVGDEVTLSMASMLAATGRTEDQIKDVVTVAADLSAGLGISLESAVRNLNKTFGGTSGELGELIPSLRELTAEQMKNGDAVEMLAGQFDGLAEQMRDSTLGELEAFKNTWGDLKENTGEIIAGFFNPIIQKLDDMAQAAIDASESIELLRGGQAGGTGGLSEIDQLRLELEALEESRTVISQNLSNLQNSPADFQGRERLIEQQEQELADLNTAIRAVSTKINLYSDIQDEINRGQAGSSGGGEGGGLTPDQLLLAEIKAALQGQIQQNYRMNDVMEGIGEDFDLFGANNSAVKDALQELVQNGFTMKGSGIQSLVSEFGDYLVNPDDMYNAVIEGFTGTADKLRDMFNRGEAESEGGGAAEKTEETAEATSELKNGLMGLVQNMKESIGPAQIWQEIFSQFGQVLNFVAKLANPLVTIFLGMSQVLAPLIEQLLAPLVGILMVVGQVIGNLLAPALLVLKPIIETIANIFLAFYNSVVVPLNNAIQSFFTSIINAVIKMFRKAIKAINKIPGVDIKKPKYIDDDRGHLKKLSLPELAGAGYGDFNVVPPSDLWNMNPINLPDEPETSDSPNSPRAANYSQGRDVTVNVQINTEVIAGDPGIRQLALMIRDEIFAAEALGI